MAPLIFSWGVVGCVNDPKDVEAIVEADTMPSERAYNIRLIHTDSARLKALVEAPLMMRYNDQDGRTVCPDGIHITFYSENGEVESELQAEHAVSYAQRKTMEARRDVVVRNTRGETLNTEHLIWDEKAKRIFTDEFVRITTAEEVIFGHGLESNETFTEYRIMDIKGTIDLKDDKGSEIP